MATPKKSSSLVWGVILIAFGVLFLLDQLDVDIWDTVWRFWPVIFIIWGGSKLWMGLKEKSAQDRPSTSTPDKTHEI